nr:MAG: hypothetical protein [Microvirus sp.]
MRYRSRSRSRRKKSRRVFKYRNSRGGIRL